MKEAVEEAICNGWQITTSTTASQALQEARTAPPEVELELVVDSGRMKEVASAGYLNTQCSCLNCVHSAINHGSDRLIGRILAIAEPLGIGIGLLTLLMDVRATFMVCVGGLMFILTATGVWCLSASYNSTKATPPRVERTIEEHVRRRVSELLGD